MLRPPVILTIRWTEIAGIAHQILLPLTLILGISIRVLVIFPLQEWKWNEPAIRIDLRIALIRFDWEVTLRYLLIWLTLAKGLADHRHPYTLSCNPSQRFELLLRHIMLILRCICPAVSVLAV